MQDFSAGAEVLQIAGAWMVTTDGNQAMGAWSLIDDAWQARDCEYELAWVTSVAVTGQPRPMVAVGYADRTIMLIDPTAARLADPAQLPEPATALAFSASGDFAARHGTDLALLLRNLATQ